MNTSEDYGLFPEIPLVAPELSTCSQCQHIIGVRFGNGNLFFCTAQNHGRFGKKIKKTSVSCKMFKQGEGLIRHVNGYYGGQESEGIKR